MGTVALTASILLTAIPGAVGADTKNVWSELKSGRAFALMRHATAPGTGDPDNFVIGDCSTQRNLSEAGRDEARRMGELFRTRGIASARVLSSAWCRCADTARLMNLGEVETLAVLNSFFGTPSAAGRQTSALKAWLTENAADMPVILVTHQVNITALTGIYPRSGQVVVASMDDDGTVRTIGRIDPPD